MSADQPPVGEGPTELTPKPVPPPGEHVLVRCPGFRCLAYKDADGNWRDSHHGEILPNVIEVLPG